MEDRLLRLKEVLEVIPRFTGDMVPRRLGGILSSAGKTWPLFPLADVRLAKKSSQGNPRKNQPTPASSADAR